MDRPARIGAIVTDREVDRELGSLPIKPPEPVPRRCVHHAAGESYGSFRQARRVRLRPYPPVSRWPLISVCEGDAEGPDRLEAVVVVDLLEGVPQIHEIHARLELPVAE